MDEDIEQMHIFRFEYAPGGDAPALVVDNQRSEVYAGDNRIHLEPLVFRLLNILLVRAGRLVSRDDLYVFLGRDKDESASRVLNNSVSALRAALREVYGENGPAPIKTGRTGTKGYYFEGNVTAEAQTYEAVTDAPPLRAGEHLASARGILVEKLYVNHGIECWSLRSSETGRIDRLVRAAVSQTGVRRLRRERAICNIAMERTAPQEVVIPCEENFLVPFHQTLSWPIPPRSLETSFREGRFPADMGLAERVELAAAIGEKIAALHAAGIIHGDIKAGVVLIIEAKSSAGRSFDVRLSGLAHAYAAPQNPAVDVDADLALQERDWRRRRDDSFVYRAPELLTAFRIDEMTDIYALGIVTYKLITGDIDLSFAANWQDDIECPILRSDIATATTREPSARIASAAEFAARLRNYKERRRTYDAGVAEHRRLVEEDARRERERLRRPLVMAIYAVLASGLLISSLFAVQMYKAQRQANEEARIAAAARDLLHNVLVSADPRDAPGRRAETIEDVLRRAETAILRDYADDPNAAIANHLVLANVLRGRAELEGERDNLERAIALIEQQRPIDAPHLATTLYAYASSLAVTRSSGNKEFAAVTRAKALAQIERADALLVRMSNPSPSLLAAQAYARANMTSRRGDYLATRDNLAPWFDLQSSNDLPLNRRSYNTVILFAESLFRTGAPEEALATLTWLASAESDAIPHWITINRRTLTAQISDALGLHDTEEKFVSTLTMIHKIYGEESALPEANLRHYYGNFLEAEGRLEEAEKQQAKAQNIYCNAAATELYCEGLGLSLGGIQVNMGQYHRAIENTLPARDVFLKVHPIGAVHANYVLALAYAGIGEYVEARAFAKDLDPASLEQGAPGENWDLRVKIINALVGGKSTADAFEGAILEYENAGGDQASINTFRTIAQTCRKRC